jgi:hypothetical protein
VKLACLRGRLDRLCATNAVNGAAHLVDHVLPRAPYRQWVFTFPIPVRLALGRRPHLATAALQTCLRVLFAWRRRRTRCRGPRSPATGALTFVQRSGSALQQNAYSHGPVPDGAFDDDGVFVAALAPDDDDVKTIHGLFVPTSRLRATVVPRAESPSPCSASSSSTPPPPTPPASPPASSWVPPVRPRHRLDWAALWRRLFPVDVMVCSRCDGPMRVIAFLEGPSVVRRILAHLGLPAESLPVAKAQAPPVAVERQFPLPGSITARDLR